MTIARAPELANLMVESSSHLSQGSTSTSHGGGAYDGLDPLVPYRIQPLAYQPLVECWCQLKACRWISWSDGQPSHRYYRCSFARVSLDPQFAFLMKYPIGFKYDAFLMLQTAKDCGFYLWIDEESSEFMKELPR